MEKVGIQRIPLKKQAQNFNGNYIQNEYQNLQTFVDYDEEHIKRLCKGEDNLDRYSDIKAYDHNRITINKDRYINASPINIIPDKYFISTQGPKKETIEDLWRMIDEHKCNIIIMLCKEFEGGREKCARYWDNNIKMENYTIMLKNEENKDQYIIRDILLRNKNNQERIIKQIHYTGWPDHGVPDIQNGKVFDVFSEIIEKTDQYKGDGPIVVHCSAGVGRTGTYISMYYLEKEIKKQINDKVEEIKFSIFNLVRKLKEMRLYLVQNCEQYLFIYQFVYYLLMKYNI
jgi:protein tyrosine phosphatase